MEKLNRGANSEVTENPHLSHVIFSFLKTSEKKHAKDIKIFLKKKKARDEKRPENDIKMLLKNKQKDRVIKFDQLFIFFLVMPNANPIFVG